MAPVIYCLSLFFLSYPPLSFSASGLSSLVSPCMYDRGFFFFLSSFLVSFVILAHVCVSLSARCPEDKVNKGKQTQGKRRRFAQPLPRHQRKQPQWSSVGILPPLLGAFIHLLQGHRRASACTEEQIRFCRVSHIPHSTCVSVGGGLQEGNQILIDLFFHGYAFF